MLSLPRVQRYLCSTYNILPTVYTSYNKKNINNVTHGIALCLGCIYNRDEKFTCHSTKHKNYLVACYYELSIVNNNFILLVFCQKYC